VLFTNFGATLVEDIVGQRVQTTGALAGHTFTVSVVLVEKYIRSTIVC